MGNDVNEAGVQGVGAHTIFVLIKAAERQHYNKNTGENNLITKHQNGNLSKNKG